MKRILALLTLSLACSLQTCAPSPPPAPSADPMAGARVEIEMRGDEHPWTHLDFRNDPEDFQFLIVSDRTGGHRSGVFPAALAKAELLQPEFIMSVGDLIEGYTESADEINAQWDEFEGFLTGIDIPFFYVPGNHDLSNPTMSDIYEQRFGRRYYHFRYRDVLFLCLCSDDGRRANLSAAQLDYFRDALAENTDARWNLVFIHRPLWLEDHYRDANWTQFEALLRDRDYTVFAGHNHTYTKHVRNDRKHVVLATTGGVSSLRGPDHGEFDHVAWVTMTDGGPRIANLLLEGIWDEDVFTPVTERLLAQLQNLRLTPALWDAAGRLVTNPSLRIVNDEDVPIALEYDAAAHPLLARSWSGVDSVPPNSTQDLPLPLRPEAAEPATNAPPLRIELATSIVPAHHRRLELHVPINLAVESLRELAAAPADLRVDGDVSEWDGFGFVTTLRESGGQGAVGRFAVARDATRLHIAVAVCDDRVLSADPPAERWAHDYVELRLDPRPMERRARLSERWDNRNAIYLACFPLAEPGAAGVWRRERQPDGLQALQKIAGEGYQLEISLPLDYLRERGGKPELAAFNLNLTIVDYDDPEGPERRSSWRPAWHGPQAIVGGGMFGLD